MPQNKTLDKITLWGLLEKKAEEVPNSTLLVSGETGETITTSQLKVKAEALAAGLLEKGIRAGDTVSWQMPTRLNTVILSLALARLSVIQNPILHIFREREILQFVNLTNPQWIIVPNKEAVCDYPQMVSEAVKTSGATLIVLDERLPAGDVSSLPVIEPDADKVSWLYSTSGTTSNPKGVKHSDWSIISAGANLGLALGMTHQDVGSISYPYAHVGGVQYLAMALSAGMSVVLMETFKTQQVAEIFRKHKVTHTGASPAHYQAWLDFQRETPEKRVLPDLRLLSGGAASKPPHYYFDIRDDLGIPVLHGYGMTECPIIASNTWNDRNNEHALAYTEGQVLDCTEVKIVAANNTKAPAGESGEIYIRGDCLFKGYLDDEQTAEAFDSEGYFLTGDLGCLDAEGYLSVTGRVKDIIIRKGENISAKEIEELIIGNPKVADVAVIGLPDEQRGERVCAVIVLQKKQNITLTEITGHLASQGLMKQKWPEQLEIIDQMPKSETYGKIAKNVLRKMFM